MKIVGVFRIGLRSTPTFKMGRGRNSERERERETVRMKFSNEDLLQIGF